MVAPLFLSWVVVLFAAKQSHGYRAVALEVPASESYGRDSCQHPVSREAIHDKLMSNALFQVRLQANRTLVPAMVGDMPQTEPSLVILFSVECKPYFDWQTLALYRSWRRAGIPGKLVRLVACQKEDRENKLLDLSDLVDLETHVHDEASVAYPPLNKPWGIMSWLNQGEGRLVANDTVIMIVDADMVFSEGDVATDLKQMVSLVQTRAVQAFGKDYGYTVSGMRARNWSLPLHFNISAVDRLQSIGVPILLRKETLLQFVSDYYGMTRAIVEDPKLHGEVHDGYEFAPWIAEMFGYTLATSWLNHTTQSSWPVLDSPQPPHSSMTEHPLLIHYDQTFQLCNKHFGKRLHLDTDFLSCSASLEELASLVPPTKEEVADASCKLCVAGGDIFGQEASCDLTYISKPFSLYAWEQVHDAVSSWRAKHCP